MVQCKGFITPEEIKKQRCRPNILDVVFYLVCGGGGGGDPFFGCIQPALLLLGPPSSCS